MISSLLTRTICEFLEKTIGDDSVPIEILSKSRWKVNEAYAEYYSNGNM